VQGKSSKETSRLIGIGEMRLRCRTTGVRLLAIGRRRGGEQEVAVRSSATAEDGEAVSFARQYDSFLNVRGGDGLLDAVKLLLGQPLV